MANESFDICLGVPSERETIPTVDKELPQVGAEEDDFSRLSDFYVERLVAMKATRPDIIRGIPVHRALGILRANWLRGDIGHHYSQAQVTSKLDEFWSHSWQTPPYMKYACVLYLNNGLTAFLLGVLFACIAAILYTARVLPEVHGLRTFAGQPILSAWCTPAGVLGHYAGLLLVARRKLVFLDVACIDQTHSLRKAEGLVSMGAFLNQSKRMLVLFHKSFTLRLWCVFELAAFLHSQRARKTELVVYPVSVGVVALVAHFGFSLLMLITVLTPSLSEYVPWGLIRFAALCFPSLIVLAFAGVVHSRSIDEIHQQVLNFKIERSLCGCCEINHVSQTGEPIACDRQIICRCIMAWFGSLESFENHVRGKVRAILVQQLMQDAFSYWRMTQVASPIMFAHLDIMASRAREYGWHSGYAMSPLLFIVRDCFVVLPSLLLVLLQLSYKLRKAYDTALKRLLFSFLLCFLGVGMYVVARCFLMLCRHFLESEALADVVVLAVLSPLSLLMWWHSPRAESDLE